jgi:carbamoyl-phosphate synthase large subunit
MARMATQIMLGKKISDLGVMKKSVKHFGVKEAVFPFNMFPEVDPVLGPEMRSTGEVLGMADSFGLAFFKAQEATQSPLPTEGSVLITVADKDKQSIIEAAKLIQKLGFGIYATDGTKKFLDQHGIKSTYIKKIKEGRPNIVDAVKNDQIQLIINTPRGKHLQADDSYIRKAAIKHKILYITTTAAATAAAIGISARREGEIEVKPLQEYHAEIL